MTLFLHGFGLCAFFLSRMDYFDSILYTRDGLSFHLSSMTLCTWEVFSLG